MRIDYEYQTIPVLFDLGRESYEKTPFISDQLINEVVQKHAVDGWRVISLVPGRSDLMLFMEREKPTKYVYSLSSCKNLSDLPTAINELTLEGWEFVQAYLKDENEVYPIVYILVRTKMPL